MSNVQRSTRLTNVCKLHAQTGAGISNSVNRKYVPRTTHVRDTQDDHTQLETTAAAVAPLPHPIYTHHAQPPSIIKEMKQMWNKRFL